MSLDDLLAQDAALFVDPSASFEVETCQLVPLTGEPRNVDLQVFRSVSENDSTPDRSDAGLRVFMRRHATLGALSLNVGGDRVKIASRRGGTPELRLIVELESSDAGGFVLRLE